MRELSNCMSDQNKMFRRKVLQASGAALAASGISTTAAASDGSRQTTAQRVGEADQIAVYEREDGLFLYDKRDLSETGQIHAYAGPKPESSPTANTLNNQQLEELIDNYSDSQEIKAQQNGEASALSPIPGVSAEIGGEQIGESDVIDQSQHGIYLAIESPGSPINPGIDTLVDFICSLVDEFRGTSAASGTGSQPTAAIPVGKVAAALKGMVVAYSCSLIFEPLAYAIIDGDATMVFHDEDWFHWESRERVPAIMNATENEYLTDEPWEEVRTGLLIAPANMESLIEHGTTTLPHPYVWGEIEEPS